MESHNTNKFVCDLCGVSISIRSNMLKHMKSCHLNFRYPCPDCENSFATKDYLRFHRTQIHGMEARFKCDFCSRNFAFGTALKEHTRQFQGLCNTDGRHARITSRSGKFRAPRTQMAPELKEYINSLKKFDEGWECSFCSKIISKKQNIEKHRDMHLQIKRFSCDFCEKKFGAKSILDTHRRIHTLEKPYSCQECGTKFGDYSTLIKHKKKHLAQQSNV